MNQTTYVRTKIEVMVEQPHLSRVVKLLETEQVRCYMTFRSDSAKAATGSGCLIPCLIPRIGFF